jgi:hypothetical protein
VLAIAAITSNTSVPLVFGRHSDERHAARERVLAGRGTDAKYGARHLKRAIEKHVVFPLANLVATGQVKLGDFVRIDPTPEGKMVFVEAEGALVPVLLEKYGQEAAPADCGRAGRGSGARRDFSAAENQLGHERPCRAVSCLAAYTRGFASEPQHTSIQLFTTPETSNSTRRPKFAMYNPVRSFVG